MKSIKVLTLNTWMREGPYEERRQLIHEWIERLQLDLIGFQEIEETQTPELLDGFGYQHTASRWEFEDINHFDLPSFDDGLTSGGPVLATKFSTPIGSIPFVNATTYHYLLRHGWQRESQMPALNDYLQSRRIDGGYPIILVGDFNAVPESNEHRYMRGLNSIDGTSTYYTDAWEVHNSQGSGATWSTENAYASIYGLPDRRIDYIYVASMGVRGPGAVLDCRVVCNEEKGGVWPSDHFGVYAELSTS